jgi:hypothetical protein
MTAHAQEVFNPAAFPRTYAMTVAGKWMVSILGAFLVALSLIGAIPFLLAELDRTSAGSGVLLALCVGLGLLGLYLLAAAFFYRVILQADSIEVFEIYRRRRLARGEIEGRSHFANALGPSGWVLVPKPGFGGKIKLSMYLKTDKNFLAWIRLLPDLDLAKKRAAEQEKTEAIAALKERGFSQLTIQRLRRAASGLNWVVYGLGLVSFFMRDPDHVLTWALVVLPWLGILLVAHFTPYYRFGGPRGSSQPDLSLVLILPGAFLMLHALRGVSPVGWEKPLMLTVLGSVILVGVAFWCDPWLKKHLGIAALVLTLCCGYGYGAGLEVNALLDRSAPQTYSVIITGKHVSHGKSTSYHLQLAPWGPEASGQDLMVSYSQYVATKTGDTVCMLLRAGALGVAWSELGGCNGAY